MMPLTRMSCTSEPHEPHRAVAVRHQPDAAVADGAHGTPIGRQRLRAHGVARTKRLRLPRQPPYVRR
jgi:hypothetical protein